MRRYFGIIFTVVIMLLVLIGMNALSFVQLDRPPESENDPNRSSYNTGPTGTRAFYQLLEESGYQVARWRGDYDALQFDAADVALVMVGPGLSGDWLTGDDATELKAWVVNGGRLLVISRQPQAQFESTSIHAQLDYAAADEIRKNPALENLIDKNSDLLISQPTALTQRIRGLACSRLAARLTFQPVPTPTPTPAGTVTLPTPAPTDAGESAADDDTSETTEPPPRAKPESESDHSETGEESVFTEPADSLMDEEPFYRTDLLTPVVHLGDSRGAVLADFDYGKGHVIFLTDPFIVANNGIGKGTNLTLALNLVNALGGKEKKIFFNEALHGYQSISNPVFTYIQGTPVLWVIGQGMLLALLLAWSLGRRFARPLPLPHMDRHSPLEFVGSMANLQQTAQARALALENIYPRFKARICRRLGLSGKAKPEEVAAALGRRRLNVSAEELRHVMHESEHVLAGREVDDQRLVSLVATMRRIATQFK